MASSLLLLLFFFLFSSFSFFKQGFENPVWKTPSLKAGGLERLASKMSDVVFAITVGFSVVKVVELLKQISQSCAASQ